MVAALGRFLCHLLLLFKIGQRYYNELVIILSVQHRIAQVLKHYYGGMVDLHFYWVISYGLLQQFSK
jgi:hypothetical protein